MLWSLVGVAQAGPVLDDGELDGVVGSETGWTEDVVVLAINAGAGRVAFRRRVAPRRGGENPDPVSCGYEGMKEHPESGIELGVFDLGTRKTLETWWVYEPAHERSACTPRARSEANLAAAKARFSALGLDISTPPPPLELADAGLAARAPSQPVPQPHVDEGTRVAQLSLFRGADELYSRVMVHSDLMVGRWEISFVRAWQSGERLLVLECHRFSGMRWDNRWCALLQL